MKRKFIFASAIAVGICITPVIVNAETEILKDSGIDYTETVSTINNPGAGYTSADSSVFNALIGIVTTPPTAPSPSTISLINAANPIPLNTEPADAPPSSPARSTSAQAIPSG